MSDRKPLIALDNSHAPRGIQLREPRKTSGESYVQRAVKFDEASASLRKKYIPKFKKAIGAKQTAKFLQVDNRLNLLVNVQLAALLPIIK